MNLADQVRQTLAAQELRHRLFGGDYVADPAWTMLLRLLLAKLEGRSVSTSDLCIESGVPAQTAVRWIDVLRCGNCLRTYPDIAGRRGPYVELTAEGTEKMEQYFRGVAHRSA